VDSPWRFQACIAGSNIEINPNQSEQWASINGKVVEGGRATAGIDRAGHRFFGLSEARQAQTKT
jgi:hypothetical protein